MRNILFSLCLLFCSMKSFAQYNNVCDAAYTDFNNLIKAFLQHPTEQTRNEEIYNHLDELQNIINEIHVSKEERYKLNSLQADIGVVKKFTKNDSSGTHYVTLKVKEKWVVKNVTKSLKGKWRIKR